MFQTIKTALPVFCSVFLAAALVPKTGMAIPTSDWNSHVPAPALAINSPEDTPLNREDSRAVQVESDCQWQIQEIKYVAQSRGTVICQRRLNNSTLLRRLRVASGCVDEIVNTQGQILSRRPAPCTCPV